MFSSLLQPRQMMQMPTNAQLEKMGPPFPPRTASLGLSPTKNPDIPISAVFLVLFLIGAVAHMTILQLNLRKGHKFIISGMMFGFCMARIVTQIMRIVWACYPKNVKIAIAANIFVAAGVVLLFVVNLLFAQRILRANHPHSGWHPFFHYFFLAIYVLIVLTLIMLITSVIQSFYTLNAHTKHIDRSIQLYGQTFYAVISFLPIPLVIGGLLIPRSTDAKLEKFGSGHWRAKIAILLTSSVLLCLGASFRAGVNYVGGTRPISDPANYQGKACFYVFNYVIEILVIIGYVVVRVDRRFWVPDQSHGQGDYLRTEEDVIAEKKGEKEGPAAAKPKKGGKKAKKAEVDAAGKKETFLERVLSAPEEEVFDDMTGQELAKLPTRERKQRSRRAAGQQDGDVDVERGET